MRLLLLVLALVLPAGAQYVSPYSVRFTIPHELLTADFAEFPRNDIRQQSMQPPYAQWYDRAAYQRGNLPWGPKQHTRYPDPVIPAGVDPSEWKRERLIATGLKYVGYSYQHHHIPDWCPTDPTWPWKPVAAGQNSKGLDCSNFTGWIFNYGLGLLLKTDVQKQAAEPLGETLLAGVSDFPTLVATLRTGDLLYITGRPGGEVTHVVTWVGPLGVSPDGTPLVIDSHGSSVVDSNGAHIPQGIHLRPFREGSWYHRCFAHAHRLIP